MINIGCVTESWLDTSIATEAVDIDGYTCYRRDRSDGHKGGGVACYVDANWPCTGLQSFETADLESIYGYSLDGELCLVRYHISSLD